MSSILSWLGISVVKFGATNTVNIFKSLLYSWKFLITIVMFFCAFGLVLTHSIEQESAKPLVNGILLPMWSSDQVVWEEMNTFEKNGRVIEYKYEKEYKKITEDMNIIKKSYYGWKNFLLKIGKWFTKIMYFLKILALVWFTVYFIRLIYYIVLSFNTSKVVNAILYTILIVIFLEASLGIYFYFENYEGKTLPSGTMDALKDFGIRIIPMKGMYKLIKNLPYLIVEPKYEEVKKKSETYLNVTNSTQLNYTIPI